MKHDGNMIRLNRRDIENLDKVLKAIGSGVDTSTKRSNDDWLNDIDWFRECDYWSMDISRARMLNEHLKGAVELPSRANSERRVLIAMFDVVIPPEMPHIKFTVRGRTSTDHRSWFREQRRRDADEPSHCGNHGEAGKTGGRNK